MLQTIWYSFVFSNDFDDKLWFLYLNNIDEWYKYIPNEYWYTYDIYTGLHFVHQYLSIIYKRLISFSQYSKLS